MRIPNRWAEGSRMDATLVKCDDDLIATGLDIICSRGCFQLFRKIANVKGVASRERL